jgi:hypothetical protein
MIVNLPVSTYVVCVEASISSTNIQLAFSADFLTNFHLPRGVPSTSAVPCFRLCSLAAPANILVLSGHYGHPPGTDFLSYDPASAGW